MLYLRINHLHGVAVFGSEFFKNEHKKFSFMKLVKQFFFFFLFVRYINEIDLFFLSIYSY